MTKLNLVAGMTKSCRWNDLILILSLERPILSLEWPILSLEWPIVSENACLYCLRIDHTYSLNQTIKVVLSNETNTYWRKSEPVKSGIVHFSYFGYLCYAGGDLSRCQILCRWWHTEYVAPRATMLLYSNKLPYHIEDLRDDAADSGYE
jgi:hypothetical protein